MFNNPWFLLGLVAVAIPIIVHLFNFRRYRKVYFSNTRYLQQLESETRKQSELRRRVILALRIAAIVMLVLAFAQPVIRHKKQAPKLGQSLVCVYIDNSFSMENTGRDGSLLDRAKAKAAEAVAAYKPDDRFMLLTNECTGSQFRWLGRGEFLSAVEEVQICNKTLSLNDAAQRLNDFLQHSGTGNRDVYLISDFQQTAFNAESFATDSTVATTLVPIAGNSENNLYIDTVTLDAPVCQKGAAITAKVRICNAGDAAIEKAPLRLFVNGKQRGVATSDVAAGSNADVDMHFIADADGILHCRVETNDYPVSFDDKYYFCINVQPRIKLLTINGHGTNPCLERLFADDSAILLRNADLTKIDFNQFDDNDAVILNEADAIASGLAQTLTTRVREGATLVLIPSGNIDISSYNALLQSMNAPTIGSYSNKTARAGNANLKSPLYRNVFDGEVRDMEMPTVNGHYTIAAPANSVREEIITLDNGDALLIATPYGKGMLYLWATPLREEYTDFVRQALLVPTLFNMALYSKPLGDVAYNIGARQPLPVKLPGDKDEQPPRLAAVDTNLSIIPGIHRGGGETLLDVPLLPTAGNYELLMDDQPFQGLAFNYGREESQMRFYNRSDIQHMIDDYNLSSCSVVANSEKPLDEYIRSRNNGTTLWKWCLAAALLFLAAETVILVLGRPRNPSKSDTRSRKNDSK